MTGPRPASRTTFNSPQSPPNQLKTIQDNRRQSKGVKMPKRSSTVVDSTASQPQAKRTKQTTTSDDAPHPVETPSKKRGRPRKESLAANDTQLSSAKKRGRPARESNIDANEQPPSSKKRGRPAKDSSSVLPKESASKEAAQTVETPSKKRGRPAKDASIVESAQPSSANKRGRPAKDASTGTVSKTTSPTKRGRPSKETSTATTTPVKSTKAKAKSTPTKKTGVQPSKRGRPPKSKAVVVASTAKSGTRGAKPSAKKATAAPKKKTESFPSQIGDILELSSPYIEGEWPDLAENLELEFHPDTENKIIWGRYDIGISEGYLRHKGLKMKQKMEFDYRGREANTGDGDHGVCVVEFKGQKFTATFMELTGDAPVEGVMDTKLSQSSADTGSYENGWEEYETDMWGK